MPNFASLLKDEIARLSRKEIRKLVDPLKKQVAAQRHEIAALKRDRDGLKREIAGLAKTARSSKAPASEAVAESKFRFSAAGLRALRTKLGLSAEGFGQLVGVSGQSVYNWELQKAHPRAAQLQQIAALRGVGKREVQRLLESQSEAAPKKTGRKAAKKTRRAKKA